MVRRTVCLVAAIVGFLLFELGMADEAGIPLPEGAGPGWGWDGSVGVTGRVLSPRTADTSPRIRRTGGWTFGTPGRGNTWPAFLTAWR